MKKFIDLGLKSGTLWADKIEEGFYNYDEAVKKFGNSLPKKWQFNELIETCKTEWDDERKGIKFTGPNGNSIFLPALGYKDSDGSWSYRGTYGDYWSATIYPGDTRYAYGLYFSSDILDTGSDSRTNSRPVVLVQNYGKSMKK